MLKGTICIILFHKRIKKITFTHTLEPELSYIIMGKTCVINRMSAREVDPFKILGKQITLPFTLGIIFLNNCQICGLVQTHTSLSKSS